MSATVYRSPRSPLVSPGGIDLHVLDMTATFAADVTLGAAQAALAEHQQWLPIDGDPARPLGELIERNSTGPLRLGYGAWRDLLLGVQFTNARGELITAGGRTVKNVAGYDLTKLMVGQHGQLGKIVTLTPRTYRRPTGAILATFSPDLDFVLNLLPTPMKPQWMLLQADSLSCGYVGDETTLAYYRRRLAELKPRMLINRSLNDDIADRARRFVGEIRVSVPPTRVLEFATELFSSPGDRDDGRALLPAAGGSTRAKEPPAGTLGQGGARVLSTSAKISARAAEPSSQPSSGVLGEGAGAPRWIADPAFGIVRCTGFDLAVVRQAASAMGGTVIDPAEPSALAVVQRLQAAFGKAGG